LAAYKIEFTRSAQRRPSESYPEECDVGSRRPSNSCEAILGNAGPGAMSASSPGQRMPGVCGSVTTAGFTRLKSRSSSSLGSDIEAMCTGHRSASVTEGPRGRQTVAREQSYFSIGVRTRLPTPSRSRRRSGRSVSEDEPPTARGMRDHSRGTRP